jgi:hypothetical protein
MAKKYFAADTAQALISEINSFDNEWAQTVNADQTGLASVWARNVNSYYQNVMVGDSQSGLQFLGQQGEYVRSLVPQARSLNTQFLSLITKQRLTFEPIALSTDAATLADTRVANALCKQIASDQDLDIKASKAAELASLMGASYLKACWDYSRGKPVGIAEDGSMKFSGDLKIECLSQLDVNYLWFIENFYDLDWVKVRVLKNRWDLVAAYPDLENEIKMLPSIYQGVNPLMIGSMIQNDDMVFVYEFYHRTTPALPEGRLTIYCDEHTVFFDDVNPYVDSDGAFIPIVQMKPEPIEGTGFGYPIYSNILPLQEILDHNVSAAATNNVAFGVRSILNPIGNDINVKHIEGLNFINYRPLNVAGGGSPTVLDLNASNGEIYRMTDLCLANMQQIYNLNSAIRGEPPAGVTAASALATLSANAIEFTQPFARAYTHALEKLMYYSLLCYKNFANEDMVVAVTGPNDSTMAKQFKASDLDSIKRVQCPIANPLMATAAGRLEVANQLLSTGQFSIQKYLKVLEGAPVDVLYDTEFDEQNYIQEENDNLKSGRAELVKALVTDDHAQHIRNHKALLDNTAIRNNPAISEPVLNHILEHFELAKQTDLVLYQMLKTGQLPVDLIQAQQQQEAAAQAQAQAQAEMPVPETIPAAGVAELPGPVAPAAPLDLETPLAGTEEPLPQVGVV